MTMTYMQAVEVRFIRSLPQNNYNVRYSAYAFWA
ncbi:hypothetical protein BTL_284 [Burkholderia thailandensis H0587]|nr:hypothetical protein BTL_284 [Burkholderia thailandensis H0587]